MGFREQVVSKAMSTGMDELNKRFKTIEDNLILINENYKRFLESANEIMLGLITNYNLLKKIAEKENIEIPKELVSMEVESE